MIYDIANRLFKLGRGCVVQAVCLSVMKLYLYCYALKGVKMGIIVIGFVMCVWYYNLKVIRITVIIGWYKCIISALRYNLIKCHNGLIIEKQVQY